MRRTVLIILFLTFTTIITAVSQHTLNKTRDVNFNTGLELLDKKKYAAAREFFERFLKENKGGNKFIEAEYYVAFSALNLFNPDAEQLFENFIHDYPYHSKSTSAYYDLGTFYYNNKKYDKTIEYLQKVNFGQLSEQQSIESRFRLAYSFFSQKDFEKAGPLFNQIKSSNHKYTYAASYYAAYIEYRNDEFSTALNDLKKAEESEAYRNLVPLMIINIHYKSNEYEKMLSYSEEVMNRKDKVQGYEEILLLSGEAAYRKKDFKKAGEFFKKYLKEFKGKPTNDILYRYSFCLYKTEQFADAVTHFKEIAGGKDSIGQASSYYLGLSYLKLDNKPYAFTSFDQARKSLSYPSIKEEALFNYAKVGYELSKFSESLQALKEFAKSFPKSEHNEEVQDLFSEALLQTNNYAEGLGYIENLKSRSLRVNTAYQKMAFYRGSELFNSDKYEEAIQLFNKSIQFSFDKETFLAATYWKAEAYSILKEYNEAINTYAIVFQKSLPNDSEYHLKTRYGIGYAYYNTKQYDKALPHFREFVSQTKETREQNYYDALLRLADLYYVTKQYSEALRYYDIAIAESPVDKDYAFFQKGIVLAQTAKIEEAIKSFDMVINLYPKSLHFDDAIFQKSELELENSNYALAIQGFSKIITSWPTSGFVPYAYLKRAVAFSNVEKYQEAISDYKFLLENFAEHPVANNALIGLQEANSASGGNEDLTQVIARYKEIHPQSDALVNIEFENAKSFYNTEKYDKAIEAFNNYQKAYPQNPNNSEVQFYLGESYYRLNDNENAIGFYRKVTDDKSSSLYNRAIQRMADIEYAKQSFAVAKNYYQHLLEIAKNKKERFNAWMGLMETHYFLNNLDSSKAFAIIILENGSASIDAENRALLYQGKIYYNQQKYDEATDYFLKTINNAKDQNGAEAQYLLAEMQSKQLQYKQSNETLFDLNNTFPNNADWLGKSFLLIAENYVALKEIFQAKATLTSIIDKSPQKETVERARKRLLELETIETKDDKESMENKEIKDSLENITPTE